MKKENKHKFYGLTIGDDLIYFETIEEAEQYFKNFPLGTYKIGECK